MDSIKKLIEFISELIDETYLAVEENNFVRFISIKKSIYDKLFVLQFPDDNYAMLVSIIRNSYKNQKTIFTLPQVEAIDNAFKLVKCSKEIDLECVIDIIIDMENKRLDIYPSYMNELSAILTE